MDVRVFLSFVCFSLAFLNGCCAGNKTRALNAGFPKNTMHVMHLDSQNYPYSLLMADRDKVYAEAVLGEDFAFEVLTQADVDHSYLILMIWLEFGGRDGQHISNQRIGEILAKAFGRHQTMDDWGDWDVETSNTFSEALLIEYGDYALPYLAALLDHEDPVSMSVRNSQAMRRSDYAGFMISRVLNVDFPFDGAIEDRDVAINRLKDVLHDEVGDIEGDMFH